MLVLLLWIAGRRKKPHASTWAAVARRANNKGANRADA